jgi:hypothetical protein
LTIRAHYFGMQTATRVDPLKAFNERAKASGWTFTCGPARGFDHPALAAALALWREKAKGRTMPARADMTARSMKAYLPHMSLLERIGSGKSARYRVRLHGTVLTSYAGDKTGQFLDEIVPPHLVGSYSSVYDTVLELLEPVRLVRDYQAPEIDYLAGESLIAPLAAAHGTTPLILSITYVAARTER